MMGSRSKWDLDPLESIPLSAKVNLPESHGPRGRSDTYHWCAFEIALLIHVSRPLCQYCMLISGENILPQFYTIVDRLILNRLQSS